MLVSNSLFLFISIIFITFEECQSNKKNVLLIVVDDLRPALGIYNDPNAYTPNINRLSKNSFIFKNAHAQQALCGPSRNSFLTSRRPDSLHLYDVHSYWRESVGNFTTLPQYFKENGYLTHSIGKVFHPGRTSNNSDDSPYSWSLKPFHPSTFKYKNWKVCLNKNGSFGANLLCPVRVEDQPESTLPDLQSMDEAIRFLKSDNAKKPFFLAVGLHKPHIPLKFPREYLDFHPLNNIEVPSNLFHLYDLPHVAWNPWLDVKSRDDVKALNISFPFGMMPLDVTKQVIQHYAAAVSYIDDIIGNILNNVDKNTIIVLIGDHGVSMGEHGEFSKYSNYEVATRVPFIIHIPKLTPLPVFIEEPVELVDLFPTLVDLTGVSKSLTRCQKNKKNKILCTEGKSLANYIHKSVNGTVEKPFAFTQYPRPALYPNEQSDQPKLKDIKIMGYSIRTSMYRYTEWVEFDHKSCTPNWKNIYSKELYNLEFDMEENLNLATRPQMEHIMHNLSVELIDGWKQY